MYKGDGGVRYHREYTIYRSTSDFCGGRQGDEEEKEEGRARRLLFSCPTTSYAGVLDITTER